MICTPIGIGSSGTAPRPPEANEGNRLGVDADIGPHRKLDAIKQERRLPELRRGAGRCRCDDHVDGFEQLQYLARYQRRNFCARSTSGAGIIAPASNRSRTAGSKSFGRCRRRSRCSDAPSVVEMT